MLPWQAFAFEQAPRQAEVAARMTETLWAEIIGHTLGRDHGETVSDRRGIGFAAAQGDPEFVAAVRTTLELAGMPLSLEDADAVDLECRPIRISGRRDAVPLASDRVAVLETGEADVARRDARMRCQPPGEPLRIDAVFLDQEPCVLTVTGELRTRFSRAR